MDGSPLTAGQVGLLSSIPGLPYARRMEHETDDCALMERYRNPGGALCWGWCERLPGQAVAPFRDWAV